jgi:predicted lipoprotein with Yx(FWY)xxD motif
VPPEPTEAADGGERLIQAVDVSDQDITGGRVVIDRVVSDGPGWVVIHITADGSPGPIIGNAMVESGETTDLTVEIDVERATEQLFAILHVDAGQGGVFEFPDGPDVPATQDDILVNTPFSVVLPEVMAESMVEISTSSEGEILVDSIGMSLYLFMNDSEDVSTCYGNCAANWPPLTADGDFAGGEGVNPDLLGTTAREDGTLQITYNGWPLYYYIDDGAPGDVNGQGVGGVWFLVSPEGDPLTSAGGDDLPDY